MRVSHEKRRTHSSGIHFDLDLEDLKAFDVVCILHYLVLLFSLNNQLISWTESLTE